MNTIAERWESFGPRSERGEKSPIEAFREGLSARVRGRDRQSNPYLACSVERFLWESGWLEPDYARSKDSDRYA